jgi:hypothetical protein
MWDDWEFLRFPTNSESIIGLGLVTTPSVLIAAWQCRKQRRFYLLLLVSISIVFLATQWHGGHSLWWVVYQIMPGAKAVRNITRIGLVLLIPAAVGLAYALDRLISARMLWLALLLGIACVGEQIQHDRSFSRNEIQKRIHAIAQSVPSDAKVFFFTTLWYHGGQNEDQIEAVWAADEIGKPTINGYSGNIPPNYCSDS